LLTGQHVFEADTPLGVILRHARDEPPPPSSRTELEIPPELDRLILDCLEKDPERRPADARELAQRLSACEEATTAWTAERAERWWDTHYPAGGAT
jgi:serine/threonine-protein kinase